MARAKRQEAVVVTETVVAELDPVPEPVFLDGPAPIPASDVEPEVVYELEPAPAAADPVTPSDGALAAPVPSPLRGRVSDAEKAQNLQRALAESRTRGRHLRDELAETAARLRVAEQARVSASREQDTARQYEALDAATHLKDAIPIIRDIVFSELEPHIIKARRAGINASEKVARRDHADYDEVLAQSGVLAGITVSPTTGKPGDPAMWQRLVLDSEDPAEDAYALGRELLGLNETESMPPPRPADPGVEVLSEPTGDRASGRREVLDLVRTNAERPQGVRRVPTSPGQEVRRLTRQSIDTMPDAEYARLPEHIKQAYLQGTGP